MTLPLVSSKSAASYDSDDHNQALHLHHCWRSIFTDIILSPPPPLPPPFTPPFTAIPPLTSVLDLSAHSSHPRAKIIHLPLSSFPAFSSALFSYSQKAQGTVGVHDTQYQHFHGEKMWQSQKFSRDWAYHKFGITMISFFYVFKNKSLQGCIYLIENTVKTVLIVKLLSFKTAVLF